MKIMNSTKNDMLEVKFGLGFGTRAAADCYLTGTNQPGVTEAEDGPQPLTGLEEILLAMAFLQCLSSDNWRCD